MQSTTRLQRARLPLVRARRCARSAVGGSGASAHSNSPAMRRSTCRLLPFAVLSYVLAYIDRMNVSSLGSPCAAISKCRPVFGFAGGCFLWGMPYFEVPSNVILEKVVPGVVARIMITWGILAGLTAG